MQEQNPMAKQRDPIALLVERELGNLARWMEVTTVLDPGSWKDVELRFGDVTARGETLDIALLRLASTLLETARIREAFIAAVGSKLSAARFNCLKRLPSVCRRHTAPSAEP
jgi:hypothetical protein